MRNDKKIEESVKRILSLAQEFVSMPNQCAYTDSILDNIIKEAAKLEELHDTNKP